MSDETATAIDPAARRQLAVDLFNHVWTLLETEARTPAQDVEMIHAAHASRHHWGEVGTPVNAARGEWQISRVYSTLGRGEPALFHAQRCLDTCTEHGIGDFDLAYAHEAMARAYRVLGDEAASATHAAAAARAGESIADAEDRELFAGRPRRPAIGGARGRPRPVGSRRVTRGQAYVMVAVATTLWGLNGVISKVVLNARHQPVRADRVPDARRVRRAGSRCCS